MGQVCYLETYPCSITENELMEQSHTLELVKKEHKVTADLCAFKGIYLNCPSQKSTLQFPQAGNFDIASTRIQED